MEFYEQLTKLLSQYNEVEQIENQKKIDQSQKEKNYKKFIERLISFNKCKNETEESKLFKLYYIEYLKDYIENSISFCSPDEKKAIEILINNDSKLKMEISIILKVIIIIILILIIILLMIIKY